MLKKMLLLAVAGAAVMTGVAFGNTGPRDVYTDGARAARFDTYTDGAKADIYTDGAKGDLYTDGARVTDRRDPFTDGAHD